MSTDPARDRPSDPDRRTSPPEGSKEIQSCRQRPPRPWPSPRTARSPLSALPPSSPAPSGSAPIIGVNVASKAISADTGAQAAYALNVQRNAETGRPHPGSARPPAPAAGRDRRRRRDRHRPRAPVTRIGGRADRRPGIGSPPSASRPTTWPATPTAGTPPPRCFPRSSSRRTTRSARPRLVRPARPRWSRRSSRTLTRAARWNGPRSRSPRRIRRPT